MNIIFFLKPIVDMLYQLSFLDVVLTLFVVIHLMSRKMESIAGIDIVVVAIVACFTFSLLRDTSGIIAYIKVLSCFMLYFLGRIYYSDWEDLIPLLRKGFLIVLAVSLVTYLTGTGFKQWGAHNTFTGLYFFKTDLAAAMAQCAIIVCLQPKLNKQEWGVLALCTFFIIISNARMYYFVIFILAYIIYRHQKDNEYRMKISWRIFIYVAIVIVALLLALNYIGQQLGGEYLLFEFNSMDELYSGANTQGRNEIWENIYHHFSTRDFYTRFTGIDLVSDGKYGGHNCHNVYLWILYTTGYSGSFLFLLFLFLSFRYINRVESNILYYTALGFLTIFLLGGISFVTLLSTQLTWYPMFFLGVCVSEEEAYRLKVMI